MLGFFKQAMESVKDFQWIQVLFLGSTWKDIDNSYTTLHKRTICAPAAQIASVLVPCYSDFRAFGSELWFMDQGSDSNHRHSKLMFFCKRSCRTGLKMNGALCLPPPRQRGKAGYKKGDSSLPDSDVGRFKSQVGKQPLSILHCLNSYLTSFLWHWFQIHKYVFYLFVCLFLNERRKMKCQNFQIFFYLG